MAAKRKSIARSIRTARVLKCEVCNADLTARQMKVPNTFGVDRAPMSALRAPPRCEVIFDFSGFNPPRPQMRKSLCATCVDRVTFTATGVPMMIDLALALTTERKATEAEANADAAENRVRALMSELEALVAKYRR